MYHKSQNISGRDVVAKLQLILVLSIFQIGFAQSGQILNAQDLKDEATGRILKKEGITAYIVRDSERNNIKLTMLIAHNNALTQRIQNMVGRKALPLIFSVSTVPGQSYYFDPINLRFEQNGKTWKPDSSSLDSLIIILEENGKFGGIIEGGQTHQAVVLLPAWFNMKKPIYVRYLETQISNFQVTQAAKRP